MEMELGKRVGVAGLWRREGKKGGEKKGEMGMRGLSLKKREGGERMERREEGRAGSGVGVREDLLSPGVLHVMSAAREEIDAALAMASACLL